MKNNLFNTICISLLCLLLITCTKSKENTSSKIRVGLTTIFTNDLNKMKSFFNEKMEIPIASETPDYVEFDTGQSRFAIGLRKAMFNQLNDSTYLGSRKGAAVGIGFYFNSKKEVDNTYKLMINNGILFNQKPKLMPWNEYTAFFKDPDGNIHELISKK